MLALFACGPAAAPGGATSSPTATVESPSGVALVAACVPTGPELCFNAVDDNCNGVIDEGCGLTTGPLQFTIAWADASADVNLHVSAPTGETVDGSHAFGGGLRLERDCPRDGCNGQNEENIYFEGEAPPRGRYVVTVDLGDPHGTPMPVRVRIGARVGSKSFGADLELSRRGDKKAFTFAL